MFYRRTYLFDLLLIILFSTSIFLDAQSAYAGPAKRLLRRIKRGEVFLGGKPPKILSLTPTKELKDSRSGKYVYMYKAMVRRSSGDRNGSMVLIRGKTYRHVAVKLLNMDPGTKRLLDTFFPVSIDNSPFPPLFLNYKYKIFIYQNGWPRYSSSGARRAKGKTKFVEHFSRGLEPGNWEIRLRTQVALGDHEVSSFYSMIEWFTFILKVFADPLDIIAGKVAGVYTDWFTFTGLTKKVLKRVVTKATTEVWVHYRLTVLSKVPNMKGMRPSEAVAELAARSLNYKSKNTTRCRKRMVDKVYRHKPEAGKKVKAGTTVTLTICRAKETPTPTPTATPTPAGLNTSNWRGTWDCDDLTYGYDSVLTISGIRAASTLTAIFPTWIYQPNREEYEIKTLTDLAASGTMTLYDSHYPGEWTGTFTLSVVGKKLDLKRGDDATGGSSHYLCSKRS